MKYFSRMNISLASTSQLTISIATSLCIDFLFKKEKFFVLQFSKKKKMFSSLSTRLAGIVGTIVCIMSTSIQNNIC